MCCVLSRCLRVLISLAVLAFMSLVASAQDLSDGERGRRLEALIDQGLRAREPEARIELMSAAAKLEAEVRNWTLKMPRARVKGLIFGVMGNGYKDRSAGDRHENLTAAVSAYREALKHLPTDKFSDDHAVTQKNLCNALLHRTDLPKGGAGDVEDAITACKVATDLYAKAQDPNGWSDSQFDIGSLYEEVRGTARRKPLGSRAGL
jgi:hypothetical protein